MKIQVTFKDPDAFYEPLKDKVKELLKDNPLTKYIEDTSEVEDEIYQKLLDKLSPWVEWGEYLNVEFDLENGTATVVKRDGK